MMNIRTDINSTETYQKLFAKLENPDVTYQNFVKMLAKFHFQVKAIIQDILECRESMEALNSLNEKGRIRIGQLRDELERLELYAKDSGDPKYTVELESQRHLLAGLLKEFKEANLSSMFAIEKAQREELLKPIDTEESGVRNRRKKVDRDGLLKMSSGVTDQLLSISRQLADTTQRSQDTLDSLVSSSSSVHGTNFLCACCTMCSCESGSVYCGRTFSSPMEHAGRAGVSLCVAAGVGITPFVCLLHHVFMNPRSKLPGRIHLIWIVRHEEEITWLADLANKTITQLRNANRPDRLHLEFYVTNTNKDKPKVVDNKDQNDVTHMVVINEKGRLCHVIRKENKNTFDDDKATLLTPNVKRHVFNVKECKNNRIEESYDLAKEYPLLGCRLRRGRPHWDKVFGYWVHLYPQQHLNVYCCGTKKLVKTLRSKCKHITRTTKNKFTFIHEGFS